MHEPIFPEKQKNVGSINCKIIGGIVPSKVKNKDMGCTGKVSLSALHSCVPEHAMLTYFVVLKSFIIIILS